MKVLKNFLIRKNAMKLIKQINKIDTVLTKAKLITERKYSNRLETYLEIEIEEHSLDYEENLTKILVLIRQFATKYSFNFYGRIINNKLIIKMDVM